MYINNVNKKSLNTASIIKRITICFFVLFIIACSSKPPRLPEVTQDFCSAVKSGSSMTLSEHLSPFNDQMQNKTGVYVLEQGTEAMLSRAWLSEHAQKTIDVQYFIFSADNVGLIATDYLVKAAERGVKVRVLVDDIMVDASGNELLKLAAHENFSIKIYNPKANLGKNITEKLFNLTTDFHGLNQRMHNKTFTVDGKVSITGGRNVADEYFGYDHQFNFRDRDVLLVGGITGEIERSFNQFWESKLSVPVEQLITSKHKHDTNYDALHQYACDPMNFVPQVREQINDIPKAFKEITKAGAFHWLEGVEYISDIPGKNDQNKFLGGGGLSTDRLVSLVNKAKKSVIIQTPYLVTTSLSRDLFKALVDRGVEVKILTNSLASNDNLEAFSGYQRDRKALLETGVLIYEFKPDAQIRKKIMSEVMHRQLKKIPIFGLHAKSMVIDDETTVIGTFNVDPRSANLNTESITIIPSREIARSVKKGMLEEMKPENAWQTTLNWNPDGDVGYLKQFSVKLRRVVPKSIL
jgi:phosphatidylserine/phosphatidylglycerophosphate/cardiolipin synthase-like enzyme